MDHELRAAVQQRMGDRCEYCHLPAAFFEAPAQIDHIIPQKHSGPTVSENLAFSCFFCNSYKGPNLSGIDPESGGITRLFHPRRDAWPEHFQWNGAALAGLTDVGRATIAVLNINHAFHRALRQALMDEGVFPVP